MQEKISFKNESGLLLSGILHRPERPLDTAVIILHGFTGHKDANFLPELASYLESKGHIVMRFDLSGNGESEGKFEQGTWTKFSQDLKSAVDLSNSFNKIR